MSIDRKKAIHRPRRVIFNDDNAPIHQETATTPEGYYSYRLDHVIDTHVDSVWISIMTSSDNLLYNTKVGEVADSGEWPGVRKPGEESVIGRNLRMLIEQGTDPLQLVIDFCRKHDLEVLASFRTNMIQDSWWPNCRTQWKRDHPELCLGVRGSYEYGEHDDPRKWFWSALDYEHQAVRDRRLAVMEEICANYDVDGVELDFWRWPMLFKPNLDNLPVEQRHIDIMNDFMRQLRARMTAIEEDKGHPLLLAPRVFETIETNLRAGIDVETWLNEGLIDLLVVGGSYGENRIPVSDWVELARPHDVPVYPCKYRSTSPEQDRAVATNFRTQGAAGVYTFNVKMPKDLQMISEIGEPDLIATMEKHYVFAGLFKAEEDDPIWARGCAPSPLPARLAEGEPRTVSFVIGDDVQQAALNDTLFTLDVHLSLSHFDPEEDEVTVKLNGRKMKRPRKTEIVENDCVLQFPVYTIHTDVRREPPVSQGHNAVEVTLVRRSPYAHKPVDVVRVELFIKYR